MRIFEVRTASFLNADNKTVGGKDTNRDGKGTIYIPAGKKVEAMSILASFGYYRLNDDDCQVSTSKDANALSEAGIPSARSLIFVSSDSKKVGKTYMDKAGNRISAPVGSFQLSRSFKRMFMPL